MKNKYNIGIDIGSTTLKIVMLDTSGEVIHKVYRRHKTDFNEILLEELNQVMSLYQKAATTEFTIGVTGSAGMGVAERTGIPFVQEVVASIRVVRAKHDNAHALIDLGGEDSKIVFFEEGKQPDIRMNGSCAGGTGSFIDQMADLMNIPVEQLAREAATREPFQDLRPLIEKLKKNNSPCSDHMPVLFENEEAYHEWKKSRKVKRLKRVGLGNKSHVDCFLGIDSGSTTTKIVAIDEADNIVYSFYDFNRGNPLKKGVEGLHKFVDEAKQKGVTVGIRSSAVTGYGEDMVKSALNIDYGIVETMAHLSGAQYVEPNVSFVLDIGGQDMKSIFIRDGVISNIELNEACSSGCDSFLQNSASTMNMSLPEFTKAACLAKYPGDLGSRCTVFMNSKVKQLLRQNASLGDIAAGLSYSIVKNCLFKVLKVSNINLLGDHIVVQGGTFRNDAVYRPLELLSKKSVSSTDAPELMGALGAALYAQKQWQANQRETTFAGLYSLPDVDHIDTKELQCKGCTNKCSILRFKFENGNICYAGNKCEKVFYNKATARQKGYNAFDEKNRILFDRGTGIEKTTNGGGKPIKIGIPRALNIFENYPFWHTLFTECGFEVVLSPESNTSLYQKGVGSIMSDNICFPAKLVHGHILALIHHGVDRIFYPMIIKEQKEFRSSSNSYNCPVICGYPDVIRSSIDPAGDDNQELSSLNIVTQWPYPNRVVKAALEVAKLPMNVQLIQLNSFGCGPDSFFMDEIGKILRQAGKNHQYHHPRPPLC